MNLIHLRRCCDSMGSTPFVLGPCYASRQAEMGHSDTSALGRGRAFAPP